MKMETNIKAREEGVIAEVLGTEGKQVQQGDLLLILEAMKMENEVFADRDGIVGEILIREGDAVTIDQPLLTLY